jgi:hypothetical protein
MGNEGLRSALERLSATLDRISSLLVELRSAARLPEAYGPLGDGFDGGSAADRTTEREQPVVGRPAQRANGCRIIYGGGPSAFSSR